MLVLQRKGRDADTHGDHHVGTGGDRQPSAHRGPASQEASCRHLGLGLPASRAEGQSVSVVKVARSLGCWSQQPPWAVHLLLQRPHGPDTGGSPLVGSPPPVSLTWAPGWLWGWGRSDILRPQSPQWEVALWGLLQGRLRLGPPSAFSRGKQPGQRRGSWCPCPEVRVVPPPSSPGEEAGGSGLFCPLGF